MQKDSKYKLYFTKTGRELLFDFVFHNSHSFSLRVLKLHGGAAEITQHIVSPIMEEDVFHLQSQDTSHLKL